MAKMKFPNPKFFRAKDNVDWKAQGRNLQEVGGIIWDMLKDSKATLPFVRRCRRSLASWRLK